MARLIPKEELPPSHYVFLIDNSGSMTDVFPMVKEAMTALARQLRPCDRVSMVTYGGGVEVLLESCGDVETLCRKIEALEPGGYTPGGAAMKMAYDEAVEHYVKGGNNRIIMCTDGDFNVGVTSTEALVEMVESYLDKGIYLSIMGFGTGNYQDSKMENLSNHGNGTYTYIDCEEEMMKVFVHERSHFYSVANDAKCQVTFFDTIDSYRLIGYENRVMNNEDFEDDKKDAGEIGAGQTITALYELIPSESYSILQDASIGTFDVRYKKALGEESRPLSQTIGKYYDGVSVTSKEYNFAAGVAAYAMILRDSKYKGNASYIMAKELVQSAETPANGVDPLKLRSGLLKLINKANEISNKNQ